MVTTVFAAVTIKRFINDVGDYVGFASIVAVAILILLYFSHARESATLRERLDEAQNRIAGLEARLGQLLHAQASAQRGRQPAPVQPPPVPSPVRPMGSAIASVRRVPAAATVAAGAAAGTAAAGATATLAPPAASSPTVANGLPPAAPVGMAAPALASATKLIPDPPQPVPPAGRPDDTMFVPAGAAATAAATAAAANGQAEPATRAIPAVAAASATSRSIAARPESGAGRPPRVQIGADADTAAQPPRRRTPRSRAVPGRGTILPPDDESGGRSGRRLPLLIGGLAVIVIIVGLVLITTSGGGSTSANVPHGSTHSGSSATTGQNVSQHHSKAPVFKPASVRVSVLNGTAVANLAADVGKKLANAGYKQGNITNAASQTDATTIVFYVPGTNAKANKTAAQHVAAQLKLPSSSVRPATRSAIQSCSTSVTGTVGTSCGADVIVSVGTDRADLASGNGG